jgi:membrane-associated phospholipid phosphatase
VRLALATGLIACLLAGPGRAEPAEPVEKKWDPAIAPVGAGEYVTIGLGLAATLTFNLIKPINKRPAITIGFDESARSLVRLNSQEARFAIREASDLTLSVVMILPLLADALINAAWYRDNPRAAWRMAMVALEALAITGSLQGVTNTLASRERPYGRNCGGELPEEAEDCHGSVRYRSFFSGHSSFSFTGAALMCSQHLRYQLFGGGAPEVATCVAGFALAATTALFRMMGDMHYATDVLTGAAVGTLVGFLVPELHDRLGPVTSKHGVTLQVVPSSSGVQVVGLF